MQELSYLAVLHILIRALLAVQGISLILPSDVILGYLYRVIGASVVLLFAFLIGRYLGVLLERFLVRVEEDIRRRIIDIGRFLIYSIGILIAIAILSPEPFTFSALLILVGLGVVIALSDILRNWGSEFYIRVTKPFKVGDWIEIGGREGRVLKIDSLGVVIESISRERIHIPNTVIAREIVVNRTTPYGTIFNLYIEVPSDVDEVSALQYLTDIMNRVRPELADEPRISYKGVHDDKSVFEISIVLLNVRKIGDIYARIARDVEERWPRARVRM
ncbi:MAG: mechanosensitive ion channel family protein [Sulfolobales archaeon]